MLAEMTLLEETLGYSLAVAVCTSVVYSVTYTVAAGLNGSRLGAGGSGLKRLSESLSRRTPSKTPRRSPSRLGSKSPSRPGARSPAREGGGGGPTTPSRAGDRFIPNRSATDFEVSHFKITKEVCGGYCGNNFCFYTVS